MPSLQLLPHAQRQLTAVCRLGVLLGLLMSFSAVLAANTTSLQTNHTFTTPQQQPPPAPIYFCTWLAQARAWLAAAPANASTQTLQSYWRNRTHESFMAQCNEQNIFHNGTLTGWAFGFTPAARRQMILLLDNGWQAGAESTSHELIMDTTTKFPSFAASTPTATLAKFVAAAKSAGWAGAGLWVNGGTKLDATHMKMLSAAGVALLKFDGGDEACGSLLVQPWTVSSQSITIKL